LQEPFETKGCCNPSSAAFFTYQTQVTTLHFIILNLDPSHDLLISSNLVGQHQNGIERTKSNQNTASKAIIGYINGTSPPDEFQLW
jgi:hypothetical protein